MPKITQKENILAILLQSFNDYENPLMMDAEYVRSKIIEIFEEYFFTQKKGKNK